MPLISVLHNIINSEVQVYKLYLLEALNDEFAKEFLLDAELAWLQCSVTEISCGGIGWIGTGNPHPKDQLAC